MVWKIHTPNFLKEIVECAIPKNQGILFYPLNLFQRKLYELAQISQEIDNPKLHLWCCEMCLYSNADPESKDYDSKIFDKLRKKIKSKKELNNIEEKIPITTFDLVNQINKGEYQIKIIPAQNRHSVPIYAPKKWEGGKVIIIKLKDD